MSLPHGGVPPSVIRPDFFALLILLLLLQAKHSLDLIFLPSREQTNGVSVESLDSLVAFSALKLLSQSLVRQHLLSLEHFSGEAQLHVDDGLLVHQAALGSAVIHKELLVVNQDRLSLFHVANETAEEVGIQVGVFQVLEELGLVPHHLRLFLLAFINGSKP